MPTGKPGSTTYYEKTCPVCGQVFSVPAQKKRQQCCSKECGFKSMARKNAGKAIINSISKEQLTKAILQSKEEDPHNVPRMYRVAEILGTSNYIVSRLQRKYGVFISDYRDETIRNDGYYQYHSKANHRRVMEEHLGRKLNKDEAVHHINGNRQDNRLENLVLCSISEHTSIHHSANEIIYKLLESGEVIFNRETKRYELNRVK